MTMQLHADGCTADDGPRMEADTPLKPLCDGLVAE
jgi:hypothetical protein